MEWNNVPKRLLYGYSAVVLTFGLLLVIIPQPVFAMVGCGTNCYLQLFVWFIGLGPVGLGLIYLLTKSTWIQLYNLRILGVYMGVFAVMIVGLVFWGYNVIVHGLDFSVPVFR